jgi:hypothetical protein
MAIKLTEKFIGFVDIMGFKSLMARAEAGAGLSHDELFEIAKLLGSEKDRADRLKSGSKICPHAPYIRRDVDFQITQQFDCAVISTEISPAGVVNLIWHCATACLVLLQKGLMCRGYIKRGLIYHTEKSVYGPGHVDVVEREKQVSFFKIDANESGTPFIEIDKSVTDYVAAQSDSCVKEMVGRMVKSEGDLTAIFPFKRLNHSFMIGGFGLPKFDPEKEKRSVNVVRDWIRRMQQDVKSFVDPNNAAAVRKANHYLRILDQQLVACDETEKAIDMLGKPFPSGTFTKKNFPGLF